MKFFLALIENFWYRWGALQGVVVMVETQLYENPIEWQRHVTAMQGLARELDMPMADISSAYENALKELKSRARIKDYLSVFACRRVRELVAHK
jgi:hypothetical protein